MGLVRIFLAAAVLFSHLDRHTVSIVPGATAVQAFFLVSGFYMALILREKYAGAPLGLFYSSRALRILPTYWLMLCLALVCLAGLNVGVYTDLAHGLRLVAANPGAALALAASSVLVLGQELLFLVGLSPATLAAYPALGCGADHALWTYLPVPQGWSLSMEFWFYLLAPFLARLRPRTLVLLLAASLALRQGLALGTPGCDLLARRVFPASLCFFLAGMLAYERYAALRGRPARRLDAVALALVLAVGAGYPFLPARHAGAHFWVFCAALWLGMPRIFRLARDSRADRLLGDLSFPIYMTHTLVIALIEDRVDEYPWWWAVAGTVAASLALLVLVEAPLDRLRQRRVRLFQPGLPSAPAPVRISSA